MSAEPAPALPEGWSLRRVASTGSTNADLLAAARAGAPHGRVLAADEQTAGRGRLGRHWVTPPGTALAVSILLRPQVDPECWSWVPLLAGLAVSDALAAVTSDLGVGLKWPNDVLLTGTDGAERKIAGILVEQAIEIGALVVGIGLNVTVAETDFPPTAVATSLSAAGATGRALDRQHLLRVLLQSLAARYGRWDTDGTRADPSGGSVGEYRSRCSTIGRPVRVDLAAGDPVRGSQIRGTATGIAADGALLVDVGTGQPVAVRAGDVQHLLLPGPAG